MNEHFKSVFTVDDLKDIPLINPSTYAAVPDISFNVYSAWSALATGPDASYIDMLLKETTNEIALMQ